ncbi:hypothetical protein [Dysgonomonas sp. 25]|uniref:hypothetical protein n=1 Tax=Dysgonomonas sp. 25 TaxID=2302933 RepID=UPI0013D6B429|nr:hypothetical protein [Dysgonomonas sp. 25]NDV70215.1 hypothetical protein [Dysgonomonas sp. 25]
MKKKNILFFALAIMTIFSLFIYACSSENDGTKDDPTKQKALKYEEKYLEVGMAHNDAMDAIIKDVKIQMNLQKTTTTRELTREDLINIFDESHRKVYSSLESVSKITNAKLSSEQIQKLTLFTEINTKSATEYKCSEDFESLTQELYNMCEESENQGILPEDFNAKIGKLNIKAVQILSGEEIDFFFISTSVAKASYEYWYYNFDEWVKTIAGSNALNNNQKSWFSWKGVVKNDAAGAIGGALAGAVVAGAGAAPGALGGAIAGSAGSAALQVLDHFFPG